MLEKLHCKLENLTKTYGQVKVEPETSKHGNFASRWAKLTSYYRFVKGIYEPADIPIIFLTLGHDTTGHNRNIGATDEKTRISPDKTGK